jgi:hypothetical protein
MAMAMAEVQKQWGRETSRAMEARRTNGSEPAVQIAPKNGGISNAD